METGNVSAKLGQVLFARRMIATAFQRMSERMRCSMSRSQSARASRSRRDRINVRGIRNRRYRNADAIRFVCQPCQQIGRASWTLMMQHGTEQIEPFVRF